MNINENILNKKIGIPTKCPIRLMLTSLEYKLGTKLKLRCCHLTIMI